MKVLCNIHPWMCAYVFAFSSLFRRHVEEGHI